MYMDDTGTNGDTNMLNSDTTVFNGRVTYISISNYVTSLNGDTNTKNSDATVINGGVTRVTKTMNTSQ